LKTPCKKNYTTHFPSSQELKENKNDFSDFAEFQEVISEISEEFHIRFNDFDCLKPKLQLFSNPMDIEVTQQQFDLQIELCDLQSYLFFFNRKNEFPEGFWKILSQDTLEMSPLKCCHLDAAMFVKLHFPL
jgi:hypothetical protein